MLENMFAELYNVKFNTKDTCIVSEGGGGGEGSGAYLRYVSCLLLRRLLSANGYGKVVLQNRTCGARTLCAARSLVGVGVTAVLASLGLGAARAHRLALGGATNQAASAVQTGVRTGYVSFWQDQ